MKEFDQLVEQFTPMIHSIIRNLNIYKNHQDFYQIGLIYLWQAYKNYDPNKGKFSTYAYLSIRRGIVHELQTMMRKEQFEQYVEDDFWNTIIDVPNMTRELWIQELLMKLPEKDRQFIELYYMKGYSLKELADLFQVSYATIKIQKKKSLLALKQFISD